MLLLRGQRSTVVPFRIATDSALAMGMSRDSRLAAHIGDALLAFPLAPIVVVVESDKQGP
jgi:hypothetical protein